MQRRLIGWALATLVCGAMPARADFTLTQAGKDMGLTLTTFATGFPSALSVGPLGIAFPTTGGVLVTDYPGNVRKFATDADNQVAPPALIKYALGNAHSLATVGGHIYMDRKFAGTLVEINPNGTIKQTIVSHLSTPLGLVADPIDGHLLVATSSGIIDVDPFARTMHTITPRKADGLTVSDDGSTVYGAVSGHILGFSIATGSKVFDSGAIAGGPDGTVLGQGLLAGMIFSNNNNGTFLGINLATGKRTLIGTGGSRGDFTSIDPNDGSVLLTQTSSILRIQGIRAVPEPSGLVLAGSGIGLFGLVAVRRRGRQGRSPRNVARAVR